ncbi:PorP/SprF family type IX secretion system membrane protein [Neotamlana laminarinivorans]|uniref:Type IX secretion system membrane protein PorP/SprF n=1 Tax=Neotamlana laminarinivorans TaxID=2883124 RepID=A0A9X1I204_9FLAO|nr:type IX secretion system membrane protein PorP/SprF [Tamlana laminarinivorans]MCB4799936.1 type IX secretion system membrane protein PorP/SprF [Tamlana laminarinivorans]
MIKKSLFRKSLALITFIALISTKDSFGQQDAQYTQYMYNTMSVNAAYAGQRDVLSMTGLYRTQWVGVDGAPKTMTFGIHSPLRNERLGLGLNIVSDQLGPSVETNLDVNFSYTIPVNSDGLEFSFGVKGGVHFLDLDWSKGRYQNSDNLFNQNVNLISPTFGAASYLHSDKWYVGLSVPNVVKTEHYDDFQESVAIERLHFFLIGGYVFDINRNTKLKPAFLVKAVEGAPIIADLSVNALFNEKFTLGLAYRWDDSFSGLVGFQVTDGLLIGYAYDLTSTELNNYNSGTHEIMLRYELQKVGRLISPRFF